jgi:NTE family protein
MPDIAVALGGGGIKGIAHIGILRELEKNGLTIRAVSGTSAGGLVGAVYAAGNSPDRIIEIVTRMDQKSLFRRGSNEGPSLLGLKGLTNLLAEVVGNITFADLRIPFACTAVDINTSQEIILNEGRLAEAVLSTIAIPGVFPPRHIEDLLLVDGGVFDPVPVGVARWLNPALPVIAVSLSPALEGWIPTSSYRLPVSTPIPAPIVEYLSRLRIGQAMNIFLSGMEATSSMLTQLRLQADKPEIILRPNVGQFGVLDPVDPNELIALGEKAVQDALPQIKEMLGWGKSFRRRFRKAEAPGKVTGFTAESITKGFSE